MIHENELIDAIAECHGQRNPNANTCIKLASYYTILDHLQKNQTTEYIEPQYSYDAPPVYSSESEFGQIIGTLDYMKAMTVLDELMETLRVMQPRLYDAVIRKLTALE